MSPFLLNYSVLSCLTVLFFGFFCRLIYNSEKYYFFKYIEKTVAEHHPLLKTQKFQSVSRYTLYKRFFDLAVVTVLPFVIVPMLKLNDILEWVIAIVYIAALRFVFSGLGEADKKLAEKTIQDTIGANVANEKKSTPQHTPNSSDKTILCKDVPDGRISFRSIDSQKRIPNIEDLLNRQARSLTGEHMKKLAQAASSAPKEHLPAYYSAAAYYYFYIEHNPYSAYLCCVSTLSLLSCMSKYDLFMPEYQWIASEPDLSSMLFDGDLGINQHYGEFFSLDMISGRETGPLGAPILPRNHKYPH